MLNSTLATKIYSWKTSVRYFQCSDKIIEDYWSAIFYLKYATFQYFCFNDSNHLRIPPSCLIKQLKRFLIKYKECYIFGTFYFSVLRVKTQRVENPFIYHWIYYYPMAYCTRSCSLVSQLILHNRSIHFSLSIIKCFSIK